MSKIPALSPRPPADPRARRVVRATAKGSIDWLLELECGHWQLRRMREAPKAIVCVDCPAAGGIGGHFFEGRR